MRTRLPLVLILAMAAALLPGVARASVATSCSYDAGTATVTAVIGSGASTTLIRNGDGIEFGGLVCGGATVTTVDTIQISDPDLGNGESLTVSLAGGRLVPGKTPEDDGTDEIEIYAAGSSAPGLTLIGSDVADNFRVGSGDINLNSNVSGDPEISLPPTTTVVTVDGGKGNDVLRTKTYGSIVFGGEGNDVLYPMDVSPSAYDGGPGNDELSYSSLSTGGGEIHALGGGAATIVRTSTVSDSAQGFETFEGFDGATKFYGSADADHFIGTNYSDWFLPLGGNDIIDGGPTINPYGPGEYDMLSMGASTASITFDLTEATVTGEGTDTYTDVEFLEGSPNDDRFEGDPAEGGIRLIDGHGGRDVLDLSTASGPQSVYLGPNNPIDWLWAIGIALVIGSGENDHLVFASGDVRAHFRGGKGDDTLIGGPLDDALAGGPGNDTLRGKGGTDTCKGGPGVDAITGCELP